MHFFAKLVSRFYALLAQLASFGLLHFVPAFEGHFFLSLEVLTRLLEVAILVFLHGIVLVAEFTAVPVLDFDGARVIELQVDYVIG